MRHCGDAEVDGNEFGVAGYCDLLGRMQWRRSHERSFGDVGDDCRLAYHFAGNHHDFISHSDSVANMDE
jgi:hypothetical protein